MAKGIGDVLYNLLSNDVDVSAIVGTNIFPFLAVENVNYPYIVFSQSGLEPTNEKDGVSCLDKIEVEIEMYSETLAEVEDLADKVRVLLDRYTGTVETLIIQSATFLAEETGYSDIDRVFLKMHSYSFRHQKA